MSFCVYLYIYTHGVVVINGVTWEETNNLCFFMASKRLFLGHSQRLDMTFVSHDILRRSSHHSWALVHVQEYGCFQK